MGSKKEAPQQAYDSSYIKRMGDRGLVRRSVWVHLDDLQTLHEMAKRLRKARGL